jgi:hypothetical protein
MVFISRRKVMKSERLLKLANFLENDVPPPRFKMDEWSDTRDFAPEVCGTAACAIGWATTIPAFRIEGFTGKQSDQANIVYPSYRSYESWEAVEKFFGLGKRKAEYLFDDENYPGAPTPKQVAKRIRKFVKDAGAGGPTGSPKGVAP